MKWIKTKCVSTINFTERGKIVSYVNVYNYIILRKQRTIVDAIDYFTFDGFLFQYFFLFFTAKYHKRLAPDFGSYFADLFTFLNQKKESIYFVGAKQEELKQFVEIVRGNYPELVIAGAQDGYFDNSIHVCKEIKKAAPRIIVVGLGTPKQEEFAVQLKDSCPESLIFTCGAFISQTANNGVQYYPNFINQLNLRWLYRIIKEKGLLSRYMIDYPKGIAYMCKDLFF